jgi:DNA-binding SARP family transcriptional activator/tetratricopeptide (TPR) repeat protein
MAGVRLLLLGRFRAMRGGVEIPPAEFGGRKVRTLLRVLAVHEPDLVPHDVLAEALWPSGLPADPVGNLNVLVNRARRALGDPNLIVTGPGGYALGGCTVDAEEFLDGVAAARRAADPSRALLAAGSALALWGEPLVEDTYAEWAREPRARLLRARVEVLEVAARASLALGDPGEAAGYAADAVAADPLREPVTVLLARALAATGDRAGALARLAELRSRLADELGIDPSPDVEQLQLQLLRGRLGTPPPRATGSPFGGLAFVGRDAEVARVRAVLAEGGVVAVAGVAGAGKSRLLAEVTRDATVPVVAAPAFLPERAEAWGLARSLLREALAARPDAAAALPARVRDALAGLLPELGDGPTTVLDGESRRALVLAGGLRVFELLCGDAGAILVADDLQWADPSSLTLLGSVLARLPRLAAVLAYRPDELPTGVLAELRGARAVTDLALGPLPVQAVAELVPDADLAAALVDATDGTPFAVTEVVRELVARGALAAGPGGFRPCRGDVATLAAELGREGARRAVRRRAERHPGAAEVLALVALLARETPARTVAAASGRDERVVLDALSELAAAGLLRLGPQGWATAHDLVGETVVADLPPGERGRLHGLLAHALDAEGADPSEVARHARGAGDTARAATAGARAARRALDVHATREAAVLAESALALGPRPAVRAGLLDVRAEARAAHGDIAGALADLQDALAADPGARARRLARLAMLTSGAQDPRRAAELAELALVTAADDAARAFALETAAILDMNLGRPERAAERADVALGLYRQLGDAHGVARILDGRAMATFLDGRIAEGVEVFARVAQLFTDSGELLRVVTPRSTRGHGLVFLDRAADGLEETSAALRLARDLDAPEGQAYALWHRSEALSGLGRVDEAEADAREAVAIARSVDHRGWTATGHRALGIALQVRGVLDEAAAAFATSAEVAGDDLALFASWAAARRALVAVALGQLDLAEPLVARALTIGPSLGRYEARLAAVELAAARGSADCAALAASALAAAVAGGHAVSVPRLRELSGRA